MQQNAKRNTKHVAPQIKTLTPIHLSFRCCFTGIIIIIMSKSPSLRRIQADVRELTLDPSDRYFAMPIENDMFEWCVCLRYCVQLCNYLIVLLLSLITTLLI
jgi:hypothetical protein